MHPQSFCFCVTLAAHITLVDGPLYYILMSFDVGLLRTLVGECLVTQRAAIRSLFPVYPRVNLQLKTIPSERPLSAKKTFHPWGHTWENQRSHLRI